MHTKDIEFYWRPNIEIFEYVLNVTETPGTSTEDYKLGYVCDIWWI